MYSKKEAALLTDQFWSALGSYMAPVLSAEGEKINWINYKTGQKAVRFTMQADTKQAHISILISHTDSAVQQRYADKFLQMKTVLQGILGAQWTWPPASMQYNQPVEIYARLDKVSIFNKTDWPDLITFFKDRLIALDQFWCEYKYFFDEDAF